ncbi:dutpase [Rana grylio virus]|uniref:dUTP diphosphatase n=4 Tax=Frog virus 3 TaxID=10493 RepID=H9XFN0_FRG3V|nr:deoxyuridine triphosphatase [Rana grylio virus 9506]ACF42284.1 dUTPase [Soft-shelled turtle iridovirus]AFG73109.1 dutpase [Rana grylio virus]AVM86131.1 dUTPase [Rana nigromaculata ranavirus]
MHGNSLQYVKLSEHASGLIRGSAGAAGYDLAAAHPVVVPSFGRALVKTDLAVKMPPGLYGRVAPRSGLALKNFIDVGAGVVDPDYRGNLGVILFNFGCDPFRVKRGDRIAQLVLERYESPPILEVDSLDSTDRGDAGYGSTGVGNWPSALWEGFSSGDLKESFV